MIVRNWMQANPLTLTSDALVSEAKRVLAESNVHALPVIDGTRLRGLVTRANVLRAGHFVMRTQNPDEIHYFVTRLLVRDIMVRNPATVQATDTMQHCLAKGRELRVAQFPVLDGERLVGIISANEIFQLAAHCLQSLEPPDGLTLAPVKLGPGVLGTIAEVAEGAGAVLQAVYPIGRSEAASDDVYPERKVTLRFHASEPADIASALEAAGFRVHEPTPARRAPVPA
jgi:acetoin utilization protein AcuB